MSRHEISRAAAVLLTAALILAAGALTGCTEPRSDRHDAGQPADAQQQESQEPPSGEILLAAPPAGWVETGAMQTPVLRMAEYGPADETDDMVERLTFEAQEGQPLPDPIEFVLAVARDLQARCTGFEDINISSGFENGYATSVRLMICPVFTDAPHGQVVMAKAIQGNEAFYVITRRLQVPPMQDAGQPLTAQEMAEWTTHLKGIRVCDTRSTANPCADSIVSPVSGSPD